MQRDLLTLCHLCESDHLSSLFIETFHEDLRAVLCLAVLTALKVTRMTFDYKVLHERSRVVSLNHGNNQSL